jgi:rod shape-determining protein MreC
MRDTRRRRLVLVVLLMLSLTLIALGGGSSGPGRSLRSFGGAVFGPVQRAVAAAWQPVHDLLGGLSRTDQARLQQLQRENDQLRLAARANQYDHSRAAELDSLLKIKDLGGYTIVTAQVIGIGPAQGFADTILLDAGTQDGLKVGMTVINGDGLVGRVKTVSGSTATVLLAIDPNFKVGARLADSQQIGYASGGGSGDPLTYTPFNPQQLMTAGEPVVTNQDANFPGGIPIGAIGQVQGSVGTSGRTATIRLYVDIGSLDVVGVVVVPPRTDPRNAVLPTAVPSASASTGAGTRPTAGSSPGAGARTGPTPTSSPSRS